MSDYVPATRADLDQARADKAIRQAALKARQHKHSVTQAARLLNAADEGEHWPRLTPEVQESYRDKARAAMARMAEERRSCRQPPSNS